MNKNHSTFRSSCKLFYFAVEVELLHILIGIADADESAELRSGFSLCRWGSVGCGFALDGLASPPPSVAVEVDTRRRAEETFLVTVRLLGHFSVKDDDDHVAVLLQVAHHRFSGQPLFLVPSSVRWSRRPMKWKRQKIFNIRIIDGFKNKDDLPVSIDGHGWRRSRKRRRRSLQSRSHGRTGMRQGVRVMMLLLLLLLSSLLLLVMMMLLIE